MTIFIKSRINCNVPFTIFVFIKSPVRKLELWFVDIGMVWLLFSVIKPIPGSVVVVIDGDVSKPPNKSNRSWLLLFDMGCCVGTFIGSVSDRSVPPNKSNSAF